jgi:hypothetical protein
MLRLLFPCEAKLRGRHSQAGAWERGKREFFSMDISRSQTLFGNAFLEALLRMGTKAFPRSQTLFGNAFLEALLRMGTKAFYIINDYATLRMD